MRPIVLKHDSWHWWLAEKWGGQWRTETDICTYTRRVLWGLSKFAALAALVVVVALAVLVGLGDTLAWLAAGVVYEFVEPYIPATVFLGVLSILAAFAVLVLGILLIDKPESFPRHAWRAFKDKTCVRIELR